MASLVRVGRWIEQTPPFSWAIQVNNWLADRTIGLLVNPYLHRYALRTAAEYGELATRAAAAGLSGETVRQLDDLHATWIRRAEQVAPAVRRG